MARRSPRSKQKAKSAKLPPKPRVRTAPGKSRAAAVPVRAAHTKKGARGSSANGVRAGAANVMRTLRKKLVRAVRTVRPKPRRSVQPDPVRVAAILEQLRELYPDARCALDFRSPLELLIATILSAQCTDERVNKVTPSLFATWPDAKSLANASPEALEKAIHSTGFFRNKARAIREACADIVAKHGGQVPRTMEELVALRGVGRKTANVVLGNAYGVNAGVVVDTHVGRLSIRLGLTSETDPVKVEQALMPLVPQEQWTLFAHWLILHGRQVCQARKPLCSACALSPHCPKIGVSQQA